MTTRMELIAPGLMIAEMAGIMMSEAEAWAEESKAHGAEIKDGDLRRRLEATGGREVTPATRAKLD